MAAQRGRAAGWKPDLPHVAVVAEPLAPSDSWDDGTSERVEHRVRLVAATALIDVESHGLRALVPLARATSRDPTSEAQLHDQLEAIGVELGIRFGISRARSGPTDDATVLSEADDALRLSIALGQLGGARAYDNLGAYRFLVPMIESRPPDPGHACALDILSAYDARRNAALIDTLETYLTSRGRVSTTAESLTVHPNTLRQRLERIEGLTGLRLDDEDLLSLELSLKVHRLHKKHRVG
ncbi:MAG TPA: helix-turn-helix domain-containing protein [Solirubrobacteraceae bacterium]|nr:helix-turn-helix domain-containing protein [Solirubrobacteraceae bacterium]